LSFFSSTSSSVSFEQKDVEFVGQVNGPVTTQQATVYKSTELATWPNGDPKMQALVPLIDQEGNARTLYVPASSRLQKAIGAALAAAGVGDLEVGGVLGIQWTGFATGRNSANPPKEYAVRYISAADVAAQAA
jgi:hypothetical protein